MIMMHSQEQLKRATNSLKYQYIPKIRDAFHQSANTEDDKLIQDWPRNKSGSILEMKKTNNIPEFDYKINSSFIPVWNRTSIKSINSLDRKQFKTYSNIKKQKVVFAKDLEAFKKYNTMNFKNASSKELRLNKECERYISNSLDLDIPQRYRR